MFPQSTEKHGVFAFIILALHVSRRRQARRILRQHVPAHADPFSHDDGGQE